MSKVLRDLEDGCRMYLDEQSPNDFTGPDVDRAINFAYHDLVTRIMMVYRQYYEMTTPFHYAIVAGQQEYPIDPFFIKIKRVEINYAPQQKGSTPLRAIPVKSEEALLNLANSASSGSVFNAGYYIHGRIPSQTIGFIPIPTQSDTTGKSIAIWADTLPTDMVDPLNDSPDIPYADAFSYLIELKAAHMLMSKGQENEPSADRYLQRYEQGVLQMVQFLRDRQADGVEMIEDVEIDNLDFQTNPPF